jgi:hypothetical protein
MDPTQHGAGPASAFEFDAAADGRAREPAVRGCCRYRAEAANTFVRSARSTPPSSTGFAAVEPWVEVQNDLSAFLTA